MESNRLTIKPFKPFGKIFVPCSKSLAHRFLICAALADSESVITDIDLSEDICATINCLKNMGAQITVCGKELHIPGFDKAKSNTLNCSESGSTLRFLIPLCLLNNEKFVFTGTKKLFERPLDFYEKLCPENGFVFEKDKSNLLVSGKLKPNEYTIDCSKSSQFVSGMLFALPLLNGNSIINIINPESYSYIRLTVQSLQKFGIEITLNDNKIFVKGNQKYSPCNVSVEGDYSAAANIDAFNYIGGKIEILNLNPSSFQGDKIYKSYFNKLSDGFCKIDLSDCPDLALIMFVVAALKHGAEFIGTKRLIYKESNRSQAMQTELAKFGIKTEIGENTFTVFPSEIKAPTEIICGHNDHRIVMALSVLLSVTGGTITDIDAVKKSYPDFFKAILHT
ncbi:MAG: 3-phosphoshikimate 1-carboxyvinyltransferase [Ruminococcus sp.]|nr:3-phosphoshikimate 1-carboxyvinyltransferase [Candidatus Copronaster equi]